jgi:glyceraldehyde 3-phosphate dehydrogenase
MDKNHQNVVVGINGPTGIVGKIVLRELFQKKGFIVGAINDLVSGEKVARLVKYDSNRPKFAPEVKYEHENLIIGDQKIPLSHERDPANINWKDYGVDIVVDCTGQFDTYQELEKHRKNGAEYIVISKPKKSKRVLGKNGGIEETVKGAEKIKTVLFGVNQEEIVPEQKLYSMGSCTTNSLAPILKVIDENYGLIFDLALTVHSPTAKQNVRDGPHKLEEFDWSCIDAMIPSSSGAAQVVSEVVPGLFGFSDAQAIRVPNSNVSITYAVCMTKKEVGSEEEFNALIKKKTETDLEGVLGYDGEKLSSKFFNNDSRTGIYAESTLRILPEKKNVLMFGVWYDNKFGYAQKLVDVVNEIKKKVYEPEAARFRCYQKEMQVETWAWDCSDSNDCDDEAIVTMDERMFNELFTRLKKDKSWDFEISDRKKVCFDTGDLIYQAELEYNGDHLTLFNRNRNILDLSGETEREKHLTVRNTIKEYVSKVLHNEAELSRIYDNDISPDDIDCDD